MLCTPWHSAQGERGDGLRETQFIAAPRYCWHDLYSPLLPPPRPAPPFSLIYKNVGSTKLPELYKGAAAAAAL